MVTPLEEPVELNNALTFAENVSLETEPLRQDLGHNKHNTTQQVET